MRHYYQCNCGSRFVVFLSFLLYGQHLCNGWTPSPSVQRQWHSKDQPTLRTLNKRVTKMDSEGLVIPFSMPSSLNKPQFQLTTSASPNRRQRHQEHPQERRFGHGLFGLPWKNSIVANATLGCVYMPFWEWQLSLMQKTLHNVQLHPSTESYVEGPTGQHRMVTLIASSDEYRCIRMTYLDGGDKMQIFTSVWYPRGNLPLFGLDALQFQNGKRHLAICDFQPIHAAENDHDATYEHLLVPIRQVVPDMQDEMTDRFFDPTRYFSKQTLLGRFQNTQSDPQELVWSQLWPAYKAYLQTHIQLVQKHPIQSSKLSPEQVMEHHRAYENYVCQCDPAVPMFSSIFGTDVAKKYLYNVMFPLADKSESLKS